VLVHPSRHDNAPMTICEAMALGTPVVASRVGGVPHMITDGETGLLFESENFEQLADKICSLIEDPAGRERLAGNARKFARDTYDPDRVARQTRAAYEQILSCDPAPSVVSEHSTADMRFSPLQSFADYQTRVPLLSRDEFRGQYERLRATDWRRGRVVKCQTSGTTGSALQFHHAAADQQREWAAICHQWRRVGYLPGRSR